MTPFFKRRISNKLVLMLWAAPVKDKLLSSVQDYNSKTFPPTIVEYKK